jgi:hypothetical protein
MRLTSDHAGSDNVGPISGHVTQLPRTIMLATARLDLLLGHVTHLS